MKRKGERVGSPLLTDFSLFLPFFASPGEFRSSAKGGSILSIAGHAIAGRGGGIECPDDIGLHLRLPELPQSCKLSDRIRLVPVATQIGDGPADIAHQQHAGRMNRTFLAADTLMSFGGERYPRDNCPAASRAWTRTSSTWDSPRRSSSAVAFR